MTVLAGELQTTQGLVIEVSLRNTGDFIAQEYTASNTSFQVFDTSDFDVDDPPQILLDGVVYQTTNVDESTLFISFPGHPANLDIGEPVSVYPLAEEKWAMVQLLLEDEPVSVRIPHALSDKFTEGIRTEGEQESVVLVMEGGNWTLQDVLYKQPEIDTSIIGSDGAAPALSPTPTATGGVGALFIRWPAVLNNDPVTYKLYSAMTASFAKDANTLIYEGPNTSFTHRPNPSTAGTYYYSVDVGDEDGYAGPGPEVSTTLAPIGTYPEDFYVGNLYVDQLLGGTLNADTTLSSMFSTRIGGTGSGVDQDPTGIRIYDSLGVLATTLAPDITSIKGALEATVATFTGPAAFRHTQNEVSKGAVLNVRGATTAPVGTPSVDQPITTVDATIPTGAHDFAGCYGLVWTGSEWAAVKSTNVIRRSTSADITMAVPFSFQPWGGLTLIGTDWYVLGRNSLNDTWSIYRLNSSGTVLTGPVSYTPIAGSNGSGGSVAQNLAPAAVGTDGTNLLVAEFDDANDRFRIQVRSPTTLAVSSTINTSTNSGFAGPVVGVEQQNFDYGASRFIILSKAANHFWPFSLVTSTWTYQPTEAFAVPITGAMSGFDYDGTRFWSTRAKSIAVNAYIYKHTTFKWTGTDPLTHKFRLTWRDTDSTGGTHETDMGSEYSYLLKKRQPIKITSPAIPDAGGTDDPDAFSAYISNSGSARTDFWLQTNPASGVTELILKDTVVFSGTNPPATNNFPGATAGKIVANDLEMRGDGDFYKGGVKLPLDIDPTSWMQANYDEFGTTADYGPVRAWYDPIRKWIEVEMYIKRITSNSSSLSIHSPVVVADPYKPQYRVNLIVTNNIGGAEAHTRLTILKDGETNEGRMDIVFLSSRVWSIGEYAFIKGGWHVV